MEHSTFLLPAQPISPLANSRQSHPHHNNHANTAIMSQHPANASGKKPFDISNLMSPPEPTPLDNFGPSIVVNTSRQTNPIALKPAVPAEPISPPISPYTPTANSHNAVAIRGGEADPILFPNSSDVSSTSPQALFSSPVRSSTETEKDRESRDRVERHIASRPTTMFREVSPPRAEEYGLAIAFQSTVMEQYNKDPKGWLRRERRFLMQDREANAARHRKLYSRNTDVKLPTTLTTPSKVTKPEKPRRIVRAPVAPARIAPNTSGAPHRRMSSARPTSSTPEPRSRLVAPSREDKDFDSLPDYAPDITRLPNKPGILNVDWKGNSLDISNDPNLHLLHQEERTLAAKLRLDPATYLTSKRRIFVARVNCAKIGKEFRKTDAQQACNIDVNKASKLWTAYEKVGWLDMAWVKPFLN